MASRPASAISFDPCGVFCLLPFSLSLLGAFSRSVFGSHQISLWRRALRRRLQLPHPAPLPAISRQIPPRLRVQTQVLRKSLAQILSCHPCRRCRSALIRLITCRPNLSLMSIVTFTCRPFRIQTPISTPVTEAAAILRLLANRSSSSGTTRDNAPKQFSGPARVIESTGLVVGAVSVQLFGVRSLPIAQRCGPYRCVSVAIAALNSRLARNATVFCRTPLASQGVTYAICLDSEGADLGGYLVGEGLAKADPGQSYDYVGAEKIAHDLRRGIWKQ